MGGGWLLPGVSPEAAVKILWSSVHLGGNSDPLPIFSLDCLLFMLLSCISFLYILDISLLTDI